MHKRQPFCTKRNFFVFLELEKKDSDYWKRYRYQVYEQMKAEDKIKGILPMVGKRLGQTVVKNVGKKD